MADNRVIVPDSSKTESNSDEYDTIIINDTIKEKEKGKRLKRGIKY